MGSGPTGIAAAGHSGASGGIPGTGKNDKARLSAGLLKASGGRGGIRTPEVGVQPCADPAVSPRMSRESLGPTASRPLHHLVQAPVVSRRCRRSRRNHVSPGGGPSPLALRHRRAHRGRGDRGVPARSRLRNLSPESITWYAKCFGRGLIRYSDVPLSQVTLTEIRGLIAEMMDVGRSAGTVNGTLQAIKTLLNWAIEEDIAIGVDPRRIRGQRRTRVVPELLTDQQILALIAAPDMRTFEGRRDRMILLTFLDTGCRVSELCGMRVDHVGIPLIRVMGKGRKERLIALSPQVQREMLRYLRLRRGRVPENGALFPSRRTGGHLHRNAVGRIVTRHALAAGITEMTVSPHVFRRQFASAFLRGGGSIVHLQQVLGHADITMSRRYAAVFDADCFEASMSLSPLVGLRWK
jgi:integrase/recombinase XerD